MPGVGATVLVEADAVSPAAGDRAGGCPTAAQHGGQATGDRVTVTAIPYFQWDNRDGGAHARLDASWRQPATASQSPSSAQPAEQAD